MKRKKGQVSLEFLTTYGWAFLIALVVIGALAYFGVLSPSKYTPKRCTFPTEVTCNDFQLKAPGDARFRITNSMGDNVNITTVNMTSADGSVITCASKTVGGVAFTATSQYTWNDGSPVDVLASGCTGLNLVGAQKKKVGVKIFYYDMDNGATYTHVANGELYDTVQ